MRTPATFETVEKDGRIFVSPKYGWCKNCLKRLQRKKNPADCGGWGHLTVARGPRGRLVHIGILVNSERVRTFCHQTILA